MEKIKVMFNVDEVYSLSYDNKDFEKFIQGIIDACARFDSPEFYFPVTPQIGMKVDIMDFLRTKASSLNISPEQRKCLENEEYDHIYPIISDMYVDSDHIDVYLTQNPEDK